MRGLRMNSTTRLANSAGLSTALKWAVGKVTSSAPEMVLRIASAIASGVASSRVPAITRAGQAMRGLVPQNSMRDTASQLST